MVPANKILTVAYGTFSCTLEGFDDPFSTMTDIAEYFRDLAAEDRFFGAEPPTPDMAMLRTIAEARANRAVEARPDETGVTLRPAAVPAAVAAAADIAPEAPAVEDRAVEDRPAADEAPAMEAAPEAAPVTADAETAADAADAVAADETATDIPSEVDAAGDAAEEIASVEEAPAPEEMVAVEETPAAVDMEDAAAPTDEMVWEDKAEQDAPVADEVTGDAAALDDSAAAKLARIRDVVAADRDAVEAYGDEDEDSMSSVLSNGFDDAEDTLTAAFEQDAFDTADVDEIAEPEIADLDDAADDAMAADLAAVLTDETPSDTMDVADEVSEAADAVADDAPETDAIGGDADGPVADDAIAEMDETPVDEMSAEAQDEADERDDLAAETPDDAVAAAEEAVAEVQDTEVADAADDVAEASEEAAPAKPESGAARLFRRIRVRKVRRTEAEIAATEMDVTETAEMPETPLDDVAKAGDPHTPVETAETVEVPEQDDLMAELSAIEAELDRDATGRETASDDDEPVAAADAEIEDDDADLMAELAAIQASETPEDDLLADAEDEMATDEEEEATAEAGVAEEAEEDALDDAEIAKDSAPGAQVPADRDMERLFAATDSRFSGEDMSRRHANISHLKAAVAARRADGPSAEAAVDGADAYREDLASTVRPHRATKSTETATARPEQRPAPLMLVSEQRVEAETGGDAEPVRPRRAERLSEDEVREAETLQTASGDAAPKATPAEDFEQFAADLGAVDLPDILEAAAVYSAKVMGNEHFSRPRLLHLAAEAVDDMSREDGLRGFGQLLRDGTIRKVSRGEFALSADSRYAASADRQAG
ncbi:MAG: hypothetical protein AAF366_09260 [Pseudomonadota bacterium]